MKKIIYKTETGICIIHPTGEIPIEAVFEKDVPEKYKSTAQIVDDSVIPSDRRLRNAWDFKDGKITEDLEKSKEITKDRLRREREPLLQDLDIQYMRASEEKKDTTSIVNEKQRLRDITKLVDNVTNTNELKEMKVT